MNLLPSAAAGRVRTKRLACDDQPRLKGATSVVSGLRTSPRSGESAAVIGPQVLAAAPSLLRFLARILSRLQLFVF